MYQQVATIILIQVVMMIHIQVVRRQRNVVGVMEVVTAKHVEERAECMIMVR